jgi:transglutaminase superfamily protein
VVSRRDLIRRWLALPPTERTLLMRALVALMRMDLALRIQGFRRIFSDVERETMTSHEPVAADIVRARSYARWIEIAARHHLVQAHCLHRSLVLHGWLRSEGLPSVLRVGVRTDDGKLSSHAWVELGGVLVNDRREAVALFQPLEGISTAYAGARQAAGSAGGAGGLRGARWR